MSIEIIKRPHAGRAIVIDGVHWGVVNSHRHGHSGTAFTFEDVSGKTIRRQDCTVYAVHNGPLAKRRGEDESLTLEQRMANVIAEMIEAGDLRHPDIIAEEREKRRAERAAYDAAIKAEQQAAFEAKAREVILSHPSVSAAAVEALVPCIVDAMRWAQSQE